MKLILKKLVWTLFGVALVIGAMNAIGQGYSPLSVLIAMVIIVYTVAWAGKRLRTLKPAPRNSPLVRLTPAQFEREVAWILQTLEPNVRCEVTGRSGDGGVDVKMWRNGKLWAVVQAKRYTNGKTLPPAFVRELDSVRRATKAERAILATTARFSLETARLADRLGVRLISGAELERMRAMAHAKLEQQSKRSRLESA